MLDERLEDRLEIERRAADHLEDLAGCRLLLQRLGEIAVAALELLEKAGVLDRDDRLIGEGLDQLDLASAVWPRPAARPDGSDRRPRPHHGNGEPGSEASRVDARCRELLDDGLSDTSGMWPEVSSAHSRCVARRSRVRADLFQQFGSSVVGGAEMDLAAIERNKPGAAGAHRVAAVLTIASTPAGCRSASR